MTCGELADYLARQLNHFFPDNTTVSAAQLGPFVADGLDRLEVPFRHCRFGAYCRDGEARFNHLYSDQYLVFLWFVSNCVWQKSGGDPRADKLYCLNKSLHAFDCLYDTALPEIFLVFHGVGTVLGKATYGNYLSVSHGCTVGNQHGNYPTLDAWVSLTARASVIGRCHLGEGATVGAGAMLFNQDLPPRHAAYRDRDGVIQTRHSVPHAEWVFSP